MLSRSFSPFAPVDLGAAIAGYSAGGHDPSIAVGDDGAWLALRTPDGPATLHFTGGDPIVAEGFGPGADAALERAPGITGALDDPTGFLPSHPVVRRLAQRFPGVRITRSGAVVEALDDPTGFAPNHPVVRRLAQRFPGVRVTRSGAVVEALVRMVVGQRVTGTEARAGYTALCRALGGPAPGPRPLLLPPDPHRLAILGYAAFHPWGIERGRAETLIRVASRAKRMEEAAEMPLPEAYARITAITGVGPWTAGKVGLVALGDPDAVPVGDYHLPNTVAFALVGEERADDARMLALLEEFRPDRGRVIRLVQAARVVAPKYGPRSPTREFRDS